MTNPMELDISKTVRKSNVLNEMRNATTSMAEYRLFCIFMAHFNMKGDNVITFKLSDYAAIVGLKRPRREDLAQQANSIVATTLQIDNNATGEFEVFSVFQKFKLHHEDDGWYVTLKVNEELSPHLREESKKFIRYKLYNTIFLKSFNQQRVYELLKQYQRIGKRTISLEDLREYLSIGKNEYPVWYDFSSKVLKVAQKAIKENTDIAFEYEGIKKGRKVIAVQFTITANGAYKDRLKLGGWIPENCEEYDGDEISVGLDEEETEEQKRERTIIALFREFLRNGGQEFSDDQILEQRTAALSSSYAKSLAYDVDPDMMDVALEHYIRAQELYVRARSSIPKGLHGYMVKALREDHAGFYHPEEESEDKQKPGFDLDEFFDAATIKE